MLFHREKRAVPASVWTPCLLVYVTLIVVLLQQLLPGATATLFSAKSKKTGQITLLVDLEFKLYLAAWKNVKDYHYKQFTEKDVEKINLYEIESGNLKTLELVFKGFHKDAGFLKYRFLKYDFPCVVGLVRSFELAPGLMFLRVNSLLERVKFGVKGYPQDNLGLAETSYLCKIREKVTFFKTSTENDGYEYVVKLETSHFHAQAFNVKNNSFSTSPPTECKGLSASGNIAVIVGSSSGIMILGALAVVIVLSFFRHKKPKNYETF
ncbi:hypothetical protein EGW08_017963 [Elysia chlorotica]|uniref:Uncharacterized protein n=1 Tax=Elysia chlorotica TaxID=188477 RepID=A0A433SYA7_ELYCH|nr:hypothetical protein EGW08_017963 [Elysia chlorotica]